MTSIRPEIVVQNIHEYHECGFCGKKLESHPEAFNHITTHHAEQVTT